MEKSIRDMLKRADEDHNGFKKIAIKDELFATKLEKARKRLIGITFDI